MNTMTTIDKNNSVATLINHFSVEPQNQQKLADILKEATEQVMVNQPGFISANIHTSLDGTRVVNYVQWRSKEDFEAMLQNPEAKPHMIQAAELAITYEPLLYDVAFVGHV